MLLLTLMLSCRCAPSPPEPPEEHFLAAEATLQAALTGGDVAAAARGVEAPEDGEWADALHGAVGFLQVAEGPEELAEGLAELAAACGGCHQARGVEVNVPGTVASSAGEKGWWGLVFGEGEVDPVAAALEAEISEE